jgi:hypothetical protein
MLVGRYEFKSWPSNPRTRPWQLFVSSKGSESRYASATYEHDPHPTSAESISRNE